VQYIRCAGAKVWGAGEQGVNVTQDSGCDVACCSECLVLINKGMVLQV
jgi:hypothetical protein